jgi:hypothetical protein
MGNVSSSVYINPDIIVDLNPAEAYTTNLFVNGSYSKAFAYPDNEGRLKELAESLKMPAQLHSGGGSIFYSSFTVKGNNNATPVMLKFSVQVTGNLEAVSPFVLIKSSRLNSKIALFCKEIKRLKETSGVWIYDSIQLTVTEVKAEFLGVRESLSFMVVHY